LSFSRHPESSIYKVRIMAGEGSPMRLVRLSIFGFIAGFIAVLIFHQGIWHLLNLTELIPPDRPAWPLDPIPPFGVPSVISKAFWGGLWGALLAPLLQGLRGSSYWAGWIIIGAVALSLVAFFVVPPIKGNPIPALWPRFFAALLVNAAWGFGTALFLKLARAARD
jgi:hypothetical protein